MLQRNFLDSITYVLIAPIQLLPVYFFLQVTDRSVRAFAEHCPELQYVGFMGCSVTSKGVIHLTKVSIVTTFS